LFVVSYPFPDAILDLTRFLTSDSIRTSPVMLPNPESTGIAVSIAVLSGMLTVNTIPYPGHVTGCQLRYLTHMMLDASPIVLPDPENIEIYVGITCYHAYAS